MQVLNPNQRPGVADPDGRNKVLSVADVVASRHFTELNPIPSHYNINYNTNTSTSHETSGPVPGGGDTTDQTNDTNTEQSVADEEVMSDASTDASAASSPSASSYYTATVKPVPEVATRPDLVKQDRIYGPIGPHVKPRDLYAKPISQLLDMFAQNILLVGEAMIAAATGYKTIRVDPETGEETEVYDVQPDAKVGELILSRLMGKPEVYKEVEHTGERTNNVVIYVPDNGRAVTGRDGKPIPSQTTPPNFANGTGRPPIVLPNKDEAEPNPYGRYTDTEDIVEEVYDTAVEYQPGNRVYGPESVDPPIVGKPVFSDDDSEEE